MQKYRLVAIDMDGTLLSSDKIILNETKKAILAAYDKGVIICIATGRAFPAIKKFIDELDINIPLILYNGSRVRMSKDSSLLLNHTIAPNVAKAVYDIINNNNGTCCFWKNDQCYFNKDNEYTEYYRKLTTINPHIIQVVQDDLFDDINKFIWFGSVEFLDIVQKQILQGVEGINYFKSHTNLLEIVPVDVSKGNVLKYLSESLGIPKEEVIAIGDDENDISMIKFAGLGVAMGNAKNSVKKVADYITLTNEENGVGKVINKFIL